MVVRSVFAVYGPSEASLRSWCSPRSWPRRAVNPWRFLGTVYVFFPRTRGIWPSLIRWNWLWHCPRMCVWRCVAVCVETVLIVCCSVLQCVAVCCSVLQCVAVCCSVCCSMCCSVLQCVAVYCSVLQCVLRPWCSVLCVAARMWSTSCACACGAYVCVEITQAVNGLVQNLSFF